MIVGQGLPMHTKPEEVMRELNAMAEKLAARNCWYMAGVLLQYYDGEFAEETKSARLQAARKYFDASRQQSDDRPAKGSSKS
jgi:hypothetical protein